MTQGAIDWDAPVSVYAEHRAEVQKEQVRLSKSADAVLRRLRMGPATNAELAEVSLKYTSRISDLRARGYRIEAEHLERGLWRYTVVESA
jgi:hypothetical protein